MNTKWLKAGIGFLMLLAAAAIYLFGRDNPALLSTSVLVIIGLALIATARPGEKKQPQ